MAALSRADLFTQSLAEPTRRAILEALRYAPRTVSVLVRLTGRKQPNISNHLAKMRLQGLVHCQRNGRQVIYSLSSPYADLMFRLDEFVKPFSPMAEPSEDTEKADEQRTAALMLAQQNYYTAVLEGDEGKTLNIVNSLLADRVPMLAIYEQVFTPTMHCIGERFLLGELDEAQEHLASAATERMMARVAQFYTPAVEKETRALFACVEGNWHSLGLRMLADALRAEGWETYFLGASVPSSSLLRMTETLNPHLIVFSCAMKEQWPDAQHLLNKLIDLKKAHGKTWKIVAGGNFLVRFPESLADYPDVETASTLEEFLSLASIVESGAA